MSRGFEVYQNDQRVKGKSLFDFLIQMRKGYIYENEGTTLQ